MQVQSLTRALAAFALAAGLAVQLAAAQTAKQGNNTEYQPQVGQEGKDVVWVPTPQALVDKMLDMARLRPGDFVVDLGSGDGRTVITAAKRGVRAKGIEYNPDMVALSKRAAAREGMADKVELVQGDIFESNFSDATVVTMFLLPSLNIRLRPTLLDMKPGTRLVSNSFDMQEWKPDETADVRNGCTSYCRAYLWIVPAKVEGKWTLGEAELELSQQFQMLSGSLKNGVVTARIDGKLVGDRIEFTAGITHYSGRVSGQTIEGVARTGDAENKFTATRQGT